MINNLKFLQLLKENGINFYAGVPDSILKDFCYCVLDNVDQDMNFIAANEGNAVALCAGYYLTSGKIGMVYMQNSGLGNSLNPIVSLLDKEVYHIPCLLLVGWRGEPGFHDEPQHKRQGQITVDLLDVLNIPHRILPRDMPEAKETVQTIIDIIRKNGSVAALLVRKGTFELYERKRREKNSFELTREFTVRYILDNLNANDVVVSSTGYISRSVYTYRKHNGNEIHRDFLTIGSMGQSSQIALQMSLMNPSTHFYSLEGDGSLLMHMGGMAVIGARKPENLNHIIINNGAHGSVGGHPTMSYDIDLPQVAQACGYVNIYLVENKRDLFDSFHEFCESTGASFMEIRINNEEKKNLLRPEFQFSEMKFEFMENLITIK